MPTASMAGGIASKEAVIDATKSITASGAREMLPKHAIIPTITKIVGLCGIHGANGSSTRQTAAPTNPPITKPGPKIPPEPPEPIERPVARIRANGENQHDDKRHAEQCLAREGNLDPLVAGAQHLRQKQPDEPNAHPAQAPGAACAQDACGKTTRRGRRSRGHTATPPGHRQARRSQTTPAAPGL